jgi:hypothetical protein
MPRIRTVLFALLLASAAQAQTLSKGPMSNDSVTPDDMTARMEQTAARIPREGADRVANVDLCWPSNAEEYRSLAKHMVVLVTVVTRNKAELPLRRVFIDVGGKETELTRLSSQTVRVKRGTRTYSLIGPYREDSFYLAPTALMMSDGLLKADFAVNRVGFKLYQLPGTPPSFIKGDSDPMPPQNASADAAALKALLVREYKGFALPKAMQ